MDEQVNNLISQLVPEDIRALSAYNVPDATGMLKLDAMENPWVWPDSLKSEWLDLISEAELNRYPSASAQDLKNAIKVKMHVDEKFDVVLGNGSDELIQMLAMLVLKTGRPILSIEPSFVMYSMVARWLGIEYISIPLKKDFSLDRQAFVEAIVKNQPSLIFISQPNNPTGNLFSESDLKIIVESSTGLVVIDEAYTAFSDSDSLHFLDKHPNVLILRTLSKVGLAGLRLGMLIGHANWVEELNKVRLPYNINSLTQISVQFALEYFEEFERQTDQLVLNREALYQELMRIEGLNVWPSAANFLLVQLNGFDSLYVHSELKKLGVLVKQLHGSHPLLENCLRINVSSEPENKMFVASLKQVLAKI